MVQNNKRGAQIKYSPHSMQTKCTWWVVGAIFSEKSRRAMKLTSYFHLVLTLRTHGATPPLYLRPSW